MKKSVFLVLCLTFLLSATGFVGCGKQEGSHTHSFTQQKIERQFLASEATCLEKAKYFYSCECGKKGSAMFFYGELADHSFSDYVSDNNATCTQDGTKTAACNRNGCNATDTITDVGSKLPHTFDKQVATEKYLASPATCTEKAKYFYSCKCGEKGSATFEHGEPLNHSFSDYVSDNNATCTQDGTKTAACNHDGCNATDTITDVGSAKGHTYSEEWSHNNAEHWHAATCGHSADKDRATHTFDGNKKCTVCDYVTAKPLGLELQSSVFEINLATKTAHMIVANAVTDYDFSDKFTVADGARFDVCTDKQCNDKIASKKTDIAAGDNVFYILVTNGNDVASYTITLRRRPIYTVEFNTNGGSAVKSQQVEEDSFAVKPTSARAGYNFVAWDYDFSLPVLKDETITASWNIITYKITYVLNGGENAESNPTTYTVEDNIALSLPAKTGYTGSWDNDGKIQKGSVGDKTFTASYTINTYKITYVLNGGENSENNPLTYTIKDDITLFSPTKTGYTFAGWSGGGKIAKGSMGDKTFTASYTINQYKVRITPSISGICTINNAGTYDYNTSVTLEISDVYLGYEFLGWYNGETLLSTDNEYTFNVPANDITITAKLSVKEEMKDFYFTSTTDTCRITNVKDKTITNAVIPDYVTNIKSGAFRECSSLTNVTIGNGVTSIGQEAFSGCNGLTSVTIGNSVTSIGHSAFYGCSSLTSVTIGNSVTSIGNYAFCNCSLTRVTIPDSVTSIGHSAFNCHGLTYNGYDNGLYLGNDNNPYLFLMDTKSNDITSCIINENCKVVSHYAFRGCSSLTSITIPDGVTSIEYSAFNDCSGLESITVSSGNTKYHSDGNCLIETESKKLILGCKKSIIPTDGSVTSIGHWAFSGCSSLTSITIPDSVTSIGSSAFNGCSSLTSITIPDSVTYIGTYTFTDCSVIKEIHYNGTKEQWNDLSKGIGNWFMWNNGKTITVYFSDGTTTTITT